MPEPTTFAVGTLTGQALAVPVLTISAFDPSGLHR